MEREGVKMGRQLSDESRERTVLKGVIMGQAVADLPDPLEDRPEPAGDNDALLSQLAGDEIDRLLADEGEGTDTKLSSGRSLAEPEEAAGADNLGEFLNQVEQGERADGSAALADGPDARDAAEVAGRGEPEPPSDSEAAEAEDAAERAALDATLLEAQMEVDAERPPLLLRPLVWLNAPLNVLPEGIRAGVGKVALVTFFNALAILAYVLIFRRG